MLGRFKNPVVALGLLVLPVSSVRSTLGRFKNPVIALELSKRHRNKAHAIVVHTVYAVYAAYSSFVLVYAVIRRWKADPDSYYHSLFPEGSQEFDVLLGLTVSPVVIMVLLVVPVLAAVSVVGERRRGTLTPVQLSSLRPFDIVWGKVVVSVAPVLLPVVVCVVVLIAFSLELDMDIVNAYRLFTSAGVGAGLVVLSVAVSVVCTLCSTFAKSSASAIIMSYGLLFSMTYVPSTVWSEVIPYIIKDKISSYAESFPGWIILLAWITGLFSWCFLWACRRLHLPAKR